MPKVQVNAHEVVGAEVDYVSLVKRAASRLPFRIVKEDNQMLDLYAIGKKMFQKQDAQPKVVAAIFDEGVNLEKAAAAFKEAGLDPAKFVKSEKDGVTTVVSPEAETAEDAMTVRLSKSTAVVVSGLKKYFDGWSEMPTAYSEVLATQGYLPSMAMAMDMLNTTLSNILVKAGSVDEAKGSITKACDEFKDYLERLTAALPEHAFVFEGHLQKASAEQTEPVEKMQDDKGEDDEKKAKAKKEKKDEKVQKSSEEPVAEQSEEPAAEAASAAFGSTEEPAADKVEKTDAPEEPKEEATAEDDKSETVTKSEEDNAAEEPAAETVQKSESADVLAAVEELKKAFTEGLAAVNGRIDTLASDVDGKVSDAVKLAKSASDTINKTVFGSPDGDPEPVTKSEGGGTPPLLDTGYDRRSAA